MQKTETRDVLAAVYTRRAPGEMLRHAVTVDADGIAVTVLCRRVQLDHLADGYAGDRHAAPTCPACRRAVARMAREAGQAPGV